MGAGRVGRGSDGDGHPAEKARALGAYGYLSKPFDVDELVGAVRRALPGE